jgi:hypothetical protein
MERHQQQYYHKAIDLSLPKIYLTVDYNILDLWYTIIDNHPIHRTFFPKFHWDIASYLLTILVTMCFLSAVIFDHFVFFFGKQFSCGSRTSIFDCSSSKDDITCFWDASKLLCTSKYSDIDADNIIWIALFLTLLSIPIIHWLWFCNLYFIKLISGSSYDEIHKSKIVIISDRTMSNPHSSSNRKISFERNLFSSILHQEYNLFCGRLEKDLPNHQIFASVWKKILFAFQVSSDRGATGGGAAESENGTDLEAAQTELELTRIRDFSLTVSELKRILSQSIITAQAELKKQITLESRILRAARNSSVNPQGTILLPRNLHSMSENRHLPGQQIVNHLMPSSHTHSVEAATARLLQSNRLNCEKFKVSRQLHLFLRDCLPSDARFLFDCQLYTRSLFTSIFADPVTEFGDILHLEHQQWRLRIRVKFVLAFSYSALFVFMLTYFLLFVSSCVIENKLQKLSAVIASLGLWIIFSGFVIQPLVTVFTQYVIPQLICRDIHAARRCCLRTLKDHYFHQVVRQTFDREVTSLYPNLPPPPAAQAKTPVTFYGQLLLSSQRFSSEYSESVESPLIEKYRPLSSLSYPLLQMYIPQPYSAEMMRLLLEAEQLEISAQVLEFVCPSLKAYWSSQPTFTLPYEARQEKLDDDDHDTASVPITAPSRSSHFGQENLDGTCQDLLHSQRILKEKDLLSSIESKHLGLSHHFSLRYVISCLLRWHYDVAQHSICFGPKSPLLISYAGVNLLFQFFLLVLLIFLVQLHEVLFFLYPLLALAPIVLLGWICVVSYFILHTARRHTRERRGVCNCSDRQVLTHVTLASTLLQCGCDDCQYCNSYGMETECDYCQFRPLKPISFSRSTLDRILHPLPSPSLTSHTVTHTPKQLLLREEGSESEEVHTQSQFESPNYHHAMSSPPSSHHSEAVRTPGYTSSPDARTGVHLTNPSSPHEDSRYSDSSLESSEDFGTEIVIRVPGKKDVSLVITEGTDPEKPIREWVQDLHHEWSEVDAPAMSMSTNSMPLPPVPSRKQSLQDPVLFRPSRDSDQTILSGTISPAMLNLFSEVSPRSPSGSFDFPLATIASPVDGNRTPSIDSYLKALEMRDSYQSERMSQYQDRLLQKSVAKIHLKNRRAKSRGSGGEISVGEEGMGGEERTSEEIRSSSRGSELALAALKNRLIKNSETPSSIASPASCAGAGAANESKEGLVKSRVAKSDFENHMASLQESIEKEKYRSQELLSKRLQQKRGTIAATVTHHEGGAGVRQPFEENTEDLL